MKLGMQELKAAGGIGGRIATRFGGLEPTARLGLVAAAGAGTTAAGVYFASDRDSIASQAITWGSVLGLIGAGVAWSAGRGAMRVAHGRIDGQLAEGLIDAARHAELVSAASRATRGPARKVAIATGGLAVGVFAGNLSFRAGQISMGEHLAEQQAQSSPAVKPGG